MAYALMFHHFYDDHHPKGQGAISRQEFEALLDKYAPRLLNAREWARKLLTGILGEDEVCLTFDDGLRCQYDVALPVLRERNLNAFWFPYTGTLEGIPDRLEIYRHFRTVEFNQVEEFYARFEEYLHRSPYAEEVSRGLEGFVPASYLSQYTFYTDGDRRFRYLRDQILGRENYYKVMDALMDQAGFDREKARTTLWMGKKELIELHDEGHMLGLHSHTHPTAMVDLHEEQQRWEYDTNVKWLTSIIGLHPTCISYPCGSYNEGTLAFLREHGITIGFLSTMADRDTTLEVSRLDHVLA